MRRLNLCAVLALTFMTTSAHAQATINGHPADFDQYPSFIEANTHLPNNAEANLRCGYSVNGTTIVPDAGYMESSLLNPNLGTYTRYQRIDNKIVNTAPAPGVSGHFLIQVTEPNGMVAAKNCQMNADSDSVVNCTTAQAFISASAAESQDQNAAQQCGALFIKATPQMNSSTYDVQKTNIFKLALRQKVMAIEAP